MQDPGEPPDRFRALVEDLTQTIYEMDATGRLSYVNPAAHAIFGLTDEDLARGVSVAELLVPEDRARAGQNIGRIMHGEQVGPQEYRVRSLDGRLIPVQIESTPIWRGGQVVGLRGLVVDITARKLAESEQEALRERVALSDRMASIGTMAAGIAHEINNPLAYMIGNLAYARDVVQRLAPSLAASELRELEDALRDVEEGAERVRRIAGDVRNLARVGEGTRAVDVHRAVHSAVAIAENETRHRAHTVLTLASVPVVAGDEHRLTQVLVNLLVNAAQALPVGEAERHRIEVRVRQDREWVLLTVSDTGPGFPEALLPRVFDPFVTTKRGDSAGLGLGLAICQSILYEWGAEIQARNREEGGAEVLVRLRPFSEDAVRPADAPRPAAAEGPPGRILVVDDEPAILRLVVRVLDRHHVDTAGSGREALDRLVRETYDVILCDMMMPDGSGVDVYETLAVRNPGQECRVVFMTGGAFADRAREFLERTRSPTLTKPFEPEELERAVLAAVARRGSC